MSSKSITSSRIVLQLHPEHREAVRAATERAGFASEAAFLRYLLERACPEVGISWDIQLGYGYGWQVELAQKEGEQ